VGARATYSQRNVVGDQWGGEGVVIERTIHPREKAKEKEKEAQGQQASDICIMMMIAFFFVLL